MVRYSANIGRKPSTGWTRQQNIGEEPGRDTQSGQDTERHQELRGIVRRHVRCTRSDRPGNVICDQK